MTLLLLYACTQDDAADKATDLQLAGLELALDADEAAAGDTVGWSAIAHWSDGSSEVVDGAVVTSDVDPALRVGDDTLMPTVAGVQELTAAWEDDDLRSWSAQAWLVVEPGPAAWIDLSLDRLQTEAGVPISFTVAATDRFDNVIDADAVVFLTTDREEALVVAPNVVATVPGSYVLTATVGAVYDAEPFRVVAGDPVALDLTLSSTNVEVYGTTVATTTLTDVYGNPVDGDVALTVEGGSEVEIHGHDVTFYAEGIYTVYANAGDLSDLVSPVVVDSTGPTLDVDDPERGGWVVGTTGTVSGTCVEPWTELDEVTVNGVPVEVADDGSFSTDVTYDFGLNVIETSATDGDGNETTDTRAVLAGEFWTPGTPLPNGFVARLNQAAFDTIEVLGEGLIRDTDLTALVPNPAYSAYSEDCIDLGFTEICIEWYSIDLYVTNPSIGPVDLEIDPTSGGWIDAVFSVYNPTIDWSVDGAVLGIGFSTSGAIYADSISVAMQLVPWVVDGELGVSVSSATVTSSGFVFDWDSFVQDVIEFFGVDLSELVMSYLEGAVVGVLEDEVPAMLADALGGLELSFPFVLGETTLTLDAVPSSVSVDDLGLTLGLATTLTPDAWLHAETGLGSLYAGYPVPTYSSGTPGMQISISDDFINQALYALWGAGVLDLTMTNDDLGLDLSALEPYLGLGDLSIVVYPELPPDVIPGEDGNLLELQLGDLRVTLYDGDPETGDVAIDLYASLVAPLDMDIADGLLAPSIGEPTVWFDVVEPVNSSPYSADTEDLLQALIPLILPQLTGALGSIPIPAIEGFPIVIEGIQPDGGYITVNGDLTVE